MKKTVVMDSQFNPKKFMISIIEILDSKVTRGKAYFKTIDYDDAKPIFELLEKAKIYTEKHPQKRIQKKPRLSLGE